MLPPIFSSTLITVCPRPQTCPHSRGSRQVPIKTALECLLVTPLMTLIGMSINEAAKPGCGGAQLWRRLQQVPIPPPLPPPLPIPIPIPIPLLYSLMDSWRRMRRPSKGRRTGWTPPLGTSTYPTPVPAPPSSPRFSPRCKQVALSPPHPGYKENPSQSFWDALACSRPVWITVPNLI